MTNDEYFQMCRTYEDAMKILLTKLDILNHNLYERGDTHPHPISNIQSRIKSKESIERKLEKKGLSPSMEDAMDNLRDIAGIRVVCYFTTDIYNLINSLKTQSDLVLCQEKDYIKYPKQNGYRSYHIILGVPVYSIDKMEIFPVEIQLRTLSMDFWASMEHRIVYKQMKHNDGQVSAQLLEFANTLQDIESRFEQLKE